MKNFFAIFANAVLLFCTISAYKRLLNTTRPLFYDLTLDINPKSDHFEGHVHIVVYVMDKTNDITFHAAELMLGHPTVTVNDMSENSVTMKSNETRMICNDTTETCRLEFNGDVMPIGTYNISIKYKGKFNTDMKGLYVTGYAPYRIGVLRTVAVTDFQPTYARRVFPCFDDLQFAANFRISIKRDRQYKAISNMPVIYNKALEDGRIQDFFEEAEDLSTYQVAFVVGSLSTNISYTRGNIYTIYSPDSYEIATYLTNVSDRIIKSMEQLIPRMLPMKKIDIVTVDRLPGSDGGVSNWGLISLSDKVLVGRVTKALEEQNSLLTIARLYLHQFFGNVVFFSDVWLNKAFANYFKYWIANKVYPEWMLLEQRNLLIIRDAVENDMSVAFPSRSIDKYSEFIIHQEASAVMLTLEGIVGPHCFLEGTRFFVHKYATLVPEPKDLWVAMQSFSQFANKTPCVDHIQHENTKKYLLIEIMERCVKEVGVPVLHAFRNYSSPSEITFTQKRLVQIQGAAPAAWYILINIITKSRPFFNDLKPVLILDPDFQTNKNKYPISDEWFIINPEVNFYYLVNYDDTNWKRLANALNTKTFGKIQPATRGKLLFDAFTLARHNVLKYDVALELIKYLRKEKDYIVLNSFFHVFDYFYKKYSGFKNFRYLQEFVANSLQPALEHVGFYENKSLPHTKQHIDNLNRLQLIKWACLLGNRFCRNTASRILRKMEIFQMSHDLQETVVCAGLMDADEYLWNHFVGFIHEEESHDHLSIGIGCSQNNSRLHNYIGNMLRHNISVFDKVYSRGFRGVNFVLEYIVQNAVTVKESLRSTVLKNIFMDLINYISTEKQLQKVKLISFVLELEELTSRDFSPNDDIKRLSKQIEDASLNYNDINQWIMKEAINEGNLPARASLCVLLVMMLLSFLF